MKKTALSVAAALLTATAVPASAAVFDITSIEDGSQGGFGFSLFHDQKNSRMNGDMIEDPDASTLVAGGQWDNGTGSIGFSFGLIGGGTVTAMGQIDFGGTDFTGSDSINYKAVGGTINMTFSGAGNIADGVYVMNFMYGQQGGSIANGAAEDFSFLNLWGDHDWGNCGNDCFGVDLRLGLSENVPANPVPLPASALLLMGGLGGLGAVRKLRKKS